MKAVFEHELEMYCRSLTAYVFGAFLLISTGVGSLIYNINASVANFEYVLSFISMVFVIVVPILTMRVIAEEKKQRTDQLLYSLPISSTDVVVGKFLSLGVVFAAPMLIICLYPLLFSMFGDVYLPTSYGSIFAFVFMGLALIAVGMFLSSLTESQAMAAGLGVVVILFNYYSTTLANYVSTSAIGSLIFILILLLILGFILNFFTKSEALSLAISGILAILSVILFVARPALLEGMLPSLMKELSLFSHFSVFVNGVFDLTGIAFYLSVIIFFLFLTVQSLEKRRYS